MGKIWVLLTMSDGDELIEWVFDNDIEKAKYFEKEYPWFI
jgi:hypothetical protein